MQIARSVVLLTAGSGGTKDEDEQLTQLLREEEAQMSQKILTLRKDVRTHSTIDDGEEVMWLKSSLLVAPGCCLTSSLIILIIYVYYL